MNNDRASSDWGNPLVFERDRQPAHATIVPYADVDRALAGDAARTP